MNKENSENRNVLGVLLCIEKHREIKNKHINKPKFVEQKKHPCKLADAIEAKRNTRAKNENEDAFEYTQKKKSCAEKGGIPTKLQHREQYE